MSSKSLSSSGDLSQESRYENISKHFSRGHALTDSETGSESDISAEGSFSNKSINKLEKSGSVQGGSRRNLDFRSREHAYASIRDKSLATDVFGEETVEKKNNGNKKFSDHGGKNLTVESIETSEGSGQRKSASRSGLSRSPSSRTSRARSPTRASDSARTKPLPSRSLSGQR